MDNFTFKYMSNPNDKFLAAIDAHKRIIYKIAGFYCKDEEARKDLIQEIVFQLWKSFPKYDEQYKLSTWIYRITLNISISYFSREKRRAEILYPISESVINLIQDDEPKEVNPDLILLQKFITELKEIDRALVILHLEGNDYKEISQILGISETNVSTKINRIKERLKLKFKLLKTNIYE